MFIIDNKFSNANIPRTVRFTEKLFEDINAIAESKNVSFNMLVLQCCDYALANLDKQNCSEK